MVTWVNEGLFRQSAHKPLDDRSREDTRASLEKRRAIWPKEDPVTTWPDLNKSIKERTNLLGENRNVQANTRADHKSPNKDGISGAIYAMFSQSRRRACYLPWLATSRRYLNSPRTVTFNALGELYVLDVTKPATKYPEEIHENWIIHKNSPGGCRRRDTPQMMGAGKIGRLTP